MLESPWWLVDPQTALSQGDIYARSYMGLPLHPTQLLQKPPSDHVGQPFWTPVEKLSDRNPQHALARVKQMLFMVVTESCMLDNQRNNPTALVAPVRSMNELSSEEQAKMRAEASRKFLVLPGVPVLGDCFVDLRLIQPLNRELMALAGRQAAMTAHAVERLQNQLLVFFVGGAAAAEFARKPDPAAG